MPFPNHGILRRFLCEYEISAQANSGDLKLFTPSSRLIWYIRATSFSLPVRVILKENQPFFGFARPACTWAGAGTAGPAAPATGAPVCILLLMKVLEKKLMPIMKAHEGMVPKSHRT